MLLSGTVIPEENARMGEFEKVVYFCFNMWRTKCSPTTMLKTWPEVKVSLSLLQHAVPIILLKLGAWWFIVRLQAHTDRFYLFVTSDCFTLFPLLQSIKAYASDFFPAKPFYMHKILPYLWLLELLPSGKWVIASARARHVNLQEIMQRAIKNVQRIMQNVSNGVMSLSRFTALLVWWQVMKRHAIIWLGSWRQHLNRLWKE